jgi:hypothetical protein
MSAIDRPFAGEVDRPLGRAAVARRVRRRVLVPRRDCPDVMSTLSFVKESAGAAQAASATKG